MKVAIIHNQLRNSGGMESYMLALIHGFQEAGDEVHVHTYDVDKKLADRLHCTVHRMRLFFLPGRWKKYFFLMSCNKRFDRSFYDVSLALTRTTAAHIAVIGGVHPASVAVRSGRDHLLRRFHDRMENGFERSMFADCPNILVHSKRIAREIIKYYPDINPDKIAVKYPPIDTTFFSRVSGDALVGVKEEFRIKADRMTFLFPSRGHRRKGLSELLSAFSRLDPDKYELLVAGEKMKGFRNIPANVRYLGYVVNLSGLYSAVDYTVLPSHYEPFGLAVVESLHCGTPVLIGKQVGAAEIIGVEEGVVLDSTTDRDLAETIARLEPKKIAPDFVHRHGLSINRHIEEIKALVRR